MDKAYQLFEKDSVIQIALRAGEVECFRDADATKGQEVSFEDFGRCDGRRDGLVVGNRKSSIVSMSAESV